MNLVSRPHGDRLVVVVDAPRIDAAGAVRFKDEMRRLTEDGQGDVLLDLAAVEFLDSSGLGALVSAMKALGPDRRLDLAALSTTVAKVFQLTRMDTVFRIYPSADAALAEPAHVS